MSKITGIGIAGRMKSGKDTVAGYMEEHLADMGVTKVKRIAMAEPLKSIAMNYLGLSETDVNTQEGKASFNEFWGMTNREILQKIGTDAMRNGFHKDTWTKIFELNAQKIIDDGGFFICPDVRFPNEIDAIRKLGGIVFRIDRDQEETDNVGSQHVSEKQFTDDEIDFIIDNNGTLGELYNKVLTELCILDQNLGLNNKRNIVLK